MPVWGRVWTRWTPPVSRQACHIERGCAAAGICATMGFRGAVGGKEHLVEEDVWRPDRRRVAEEDVRVRGQGFGAVGDKLIVLQPRVVPIEAQVAFEVHVVVDHLQVLHPKGRSRVQSVGGRGAALSHLPVNRYGHSPGSDVTANLGLVVEADLRSHGIE